MDEQDKGAVCAPPASTCPASEAECSVDTNAAVAGAWDSGSAPPPTAAGAPRASRRQKGQTRSQSKAPTTTDIPAAVSVADSRQALALVGPMMLTVLHLAARC